MERIQYEYNEYTRPDEFEKLFIVKLLELNSKGFPVDEFLAFKKHDNLYGQKEYSDSFLNQLIVIDRNYHLLGEVLNII